MQESYVRLPRTRMS